MRFLGVDYGSKRIGLALSDSDGTIAFPHGIVRNAAGVVDAARRADVGAIVVGLPIPFRGGASHQTRIVRRFAARLAERVKLPIAFEDETLTSAFAERLSSGTASDAAAAALILQSYLDKKGENRK